MRHLAAAAMALSILVTGIRAQESEPASAGTAKAEQADVGESEPLPSPLGEDQTSAVDIRRTSVCIKGTIDKHLAHRAGYEFGPDYGETGIVVLRYRFNPRLL
jgi:hypothetical protein